jgi:mono/diheme cytochrome c family protein
MKKQSIFRTLIAASTVAIFIVISACGGSADSYTPTEAVKEGEPKKEEAAASPNGIGKFTDKTIAAFDAASAKEGKVLFESKCAACHKTTDEKVVGPGLKGVTTRRNANWILNMITNPEEMTKKDPVAMELLATHLTQMTNQDVNEETALKLLNYLRENDGSK